MQGSSDGVGQGRGEQKMPPGWPQHPMGSGQLTTCVCQRPALEPGGMRGPHSGCGLRVALCQSGNLGGRRGVLLHF